MTGDPEQEFAPYTYIWIYTYPELARQHPVIGNNFQHILQFENNFEPDIPLDQPIEERRRGRPIGSKTQKESWKNTAAAAWKPNKNLKLNNDPDSIASRTRSKNI